MIGRCRLSGSWKLFLNNNKAFPGNCLNHESMIYNLLAPRHAADTPPGGHAENHAKKKPGRFDLPGSSIQQQIRYLLFNHQSSFRVLSTITAILNNRYAAEIAKPL
jgi:hypothetical protein